MTAPIGYIERGKPFRKPTQPSSGGEPYFVFFLGIVGYAMLILGLLGSRGQLPLAETIEEGFTSSSLFIFFGSSLIVAAVLRNIYVKSVLFTVSQAVILLALLALVVMFT